MPTVSTRKPCLAATAKHRARRAAWTPARRARQAALIRRWQPWRQSTGPCTAAGKARSRANAPRSTRPAVLRLTEIYLREQGRFVRAVRRAQRAGQLVTAAQRNIFWRDHAALAASIDRLGLTLYDALQRNP